MKRYERIASAYWEVGSALRHPDAPAISAAKALKALNQSDRLRPEEHKLSAEMHTLRYDIIEGNTEWRGNSETQGSASILHMRR